MLTKYSNQPVALRKGMLLIQYISMRISNKRFVEITILVAKMGGRLDVSPSPIGISEEIYIEAKRLGISSQEMAAYAKLMLRKAVKATVEEIDRVFFPQG